MTELPGLKFDLGEDIEMLRDSVRTWAQAELAATARPRRRRSTCPSWCRANGSARWR
ncbi:hypothetical protein [Cupriavidus sp. a3]|uniref:hypothetical protein n=1 Tax=Cupriavidus sp. a3 TaxID=3242158 RepID=UPI003D9C34E7